MAGNDAGTAYVEVRPDFDDFGRKVGREVDKTADHAEKRLGGAFRNVVGIAAGLGAATAGIRFFGGAFDEAEEARKALAQTEAVLKSTGGVAKVTAGDVDRLATSLSNKTGIDDEAIASGQNVLLTFTKVRNEVGKGNDVFNQGTAAALDMSVALGTDLQSANILVGKALNDPIAGITALTRSGVQFTAQQKEQIKTLIASGDQLGAQKIILAELNTQFAGSAEGAASPMAKLKVVFDNIKESVGTALMPALQGVATFLVESLPGAIDKAGKVFGFIADNWKPILAGLGVVLTAVVIPAFIAWASAAYAAVAANLAAAAPILAIVAALAAVGAALVYSYKNFEGFRNVVDTTVRFVREQFAALVEWTRANWDQISAVIGSVTQAVRSVITAWVAYIQLLWRTFGDELMAVARVVWDQIRNVVETAIKVVQGIIQTVTALIRGDWGAAWDGIKMILSAAWEFIRETVVNVLRVIGQAIEAAMSGIRAIWDAGWNAMKDIVRMGIVAIVDFFLAGVELVIKGAARMFGWIPGVGDKLRSAAAGFEQFRDDVNASLAGLRDKTVQIHVNASGAVQTRGSGANASDARGENYATGGEIRGPGGIDNVPLWGTAGEWVMRKDAVDHYGPGFMDAINAKKFAQGGMIGADVHVPAAGPLMARVGRNDNDITDDLVAKVGERLAAQMVREAREQERAAAASAGPAGPGAGRGGLTGAATSLLDAIMSRFPGQAFTSGYRSPEENRRVGGSPTSDHMSGRAIDIGPGSNAVASFARSWPGIKQVLWQVAGHYDHVHAATNADTGAILSPGLNVLDNQTGAAEPLAPLQSIDYDRLGRAVAAALATQTVEMRMDSHKVGEIVRDTVNFESRDLVGGAWQR